MNYYPYHIGDYARDTGHLSMLEHGAYRQMLDIYYATEKPLPLNMDRLYRLTRANTKAERAAVDSLLSEFFTEQEDGWHHKRCDEEIQRACEEGEDNKLKTENERERQKRYRTRRREIFSALREHNIVPKWDAPMEELETLFQRHCNAPVTRDRPLPETSQNENGHGYPLANSHKPKAKEEEREERSRATRFDLHTLPAEWDEFCRQERPDLNPQKTFEKFSDYWRAKPGKDGTKLDWMATWRNWVRAEKKQGATHGTNISRAKQLETSNRTAISNWLRDAEAAERSGGGAGPGGTQHALSESRAHRGSSVGVPGGVPGVERRPAQTGGKNLLPESRANISGDQPDRADTQVQPRPTQATPF